MFIKRNIRLDKGEKFHTYFDDIYMYIYYTFNNAVRQIQINLNDNTVNRLGTIAYCDEKINLTQKTLYRMRDNIIIK